MTTLTATTEDRVTAAPVRARPDVRPIPMGRVIGVELRKMFDTRSGFWLMASIGILAVLATAATIAFAAITRPRLGTSVKVVSPLRWLHSLVMASRETIGRITVIGYPTAFAKL